MDGEQKPQKDSKGSETGWKTRRSGDGGLCRPRSGKMDGALVGSQDLPQLQGQMLSRAKLVNNGRGRKQLGDRKDALGWRPTVGWKS